MTQRIRKIAQRKMLARRGIERTPVRTEAKRDVSRLRGELNVFESFFERHSSISKGSREKLIEKFGFREKKRFGGKYVAVMERLAPFASRFYSKENEAAKMGFMLITGNFRKNDKVLSMGCGIGMHEVFIAKNIASEGTVAGIDLGNRLLERAKRIAELENVKNVLFIQKNAYKSGLKSGSFNKIICNGLFNVLKAPERKAAIEEIRRLVKNNAGSRVLITLPLNDTGAVGEILSLLRNQGFRTASMVSPQKIGTPFMGIIATPATMAKRNIGKLN